MKQKNQQMHSAGAIGRNDIPKDDHLRGLGALLDGRRMAQALSASLPTSSRITSCSVEYVRYKPSTSCVASYRIAVAGTGGEATVTAYGKCYAAENFAAAREKARARNVATHVLPPVVELPDHDVIVYVFPNDSEMRGLELVGNNKRLQRLIYEHHPSFRPDQWRVSDRRMRSQILRYKPEKRALVEVSTRAVHLESEERQDVNVYMRFYADERGRDIAATMGSVHAASGSQPFVTPRPLLYMDEQRILMIDHVPGAPLIDTLQSGAAHEALAPAARALAALHGFPAGGLEPRGAGSLVADVEATEAAIAQVVPELADEVHALVGAWRYGFVEAASTGDGFVHGDFYHGQVLADGESVGIIDFDRCYRGDPIADVANFCAHLRCQEAEGRLTGSDRIAGDFVEAYESAAGRIDPAALRRYTFLGLFQLAVAPFRSLRPGWKEQVALLLGACREYVK